MLQLPAYPQPTDTQTEGLLGSSNEVYVGIGHLKSYGGMGCMRVTCEGGCSCEGTYVDMHWNDKISVPTWHQAQVLIADWDTCSLWLTVEPVSSSNGNKVKVTALSVRKEKRLLNWGTE